MVYHGGGKALQDPKWPRHADDHNAMDSQCARSGATEAGILERKDETPAAPYHVEQEKLSAIRSRFCVVWLHRNGRGPMNCTCWFNR